MILFEVVTEAETTVSSGVSGLPSEYSGSNFDSILGLFADVLTHFFDFLSNNYIVPGVSILNFILGALFIMFFVAFIIFGVLRK